MKEKVKAKIQGVGVVAIAKNEEKDLPWFLSNVLRWFDEVVIVDDGSTDRTVEIARSHDGNVHVVPAPGDNKEGFSGLRNAGIDQARSQWLLHMDIDERVSPELGVEIASAIVDGKHDAFRFRRQNYFLNHPMKGGGLQNWNQIHIAKKDLARFQNSVHEELMVNCSPNRIGQLNGMMLHLNDENYSERMRKSDQYVRMLAKETSEQSSVSGAFRVISRPLRAFIKSYFYHLGWRDGVYGLIWALHVASAELRLAILQWERRSAISRLELEKKILDMDDSA